MDRSNTLTSSNIRLTIQQLRTTLACFGLIQLSQIMGHASSVVNLNNSYHRHQRPAPYYPASNGLAERGVQILKQGLKKIKDGSIEERQGKVLFKYRITPQSTTGTSPTQLLFDHNLKSSLDLIKTDISRS